MSVDNGRISADVAPVSVVPHPLSAADWPLDGFRLLGTGAAGRVRSDWLAPAAPTLTARASVRDVVMVRRRCEQGAQEVRR